MQIDMHYHATFCMAFAAGFTVDNAQQIATASQFVDDNNSDGASELEFKDGSAFYLNATAHHPTNRANLYDEEQRTVWVPFHFIPGNEGDEYMERLITTKDSVIAREIVEHALEGKPKSFHLQLLGIVSHCYADTFSHYGFSGLSSPFNRIDIDTMQTHVLDEEIEKYIKDKEVGFFSKYEHESKQESHRFFDVVLETFSSGVGNLAALGHGAVLTNPDRPYLNWDFLYEHERTPCTDASNRRKSKRNNPETFAEACFALYIMFDKFLKKNPEFERNGEVITYSEISDKVKKIITFEGKKKDRTLKWIKAFDDKLFGENSEPFPEYVGPDWLKKLDEYKKYKQDTALPFMDTQIFKFYQASENHRSYVLRELLPKHGLAVK